MQNEIIYNKNNFIKLKPTTKLELVLLPPRQKQEVTKKDVANFYKSLAKILMDD